MMGFCIGYVSGLKHAIDATMFLPFNWTTPRDSSVSALRGGGGGVTLWTTSPPGEEGWWTGSGSGVKEMSLHCGCTTPYMGRLGKLSNHFEPQFSPQSKANSI